MRIANAHIHVLYMYLYANVLLCRYHLYVDCMPGDGMQRIDSGTVSRIVNVARSFRRVQQPR